LWDSRAQMFLAQPININLRADHYPSRYLICPSCSPGAFHQGSMTAPQPPSTKLLPQALRNSAIAAPPVQWLGATFFYPQAYERPYLLADLGLAERQQVEATIKR